LRVWGLRFGVWGLGFGDRGLRDGVCGLEFRAQGSGSGLTIYIQEVVIA